VVAPMKDDFIGGEGDRARHRRAWVHGTLRTMGTPCEFHFRLSAMSHEGRGGEALARDQIHHLGEDSGVAGAQVGIGCFGQFG
jgi:hypothetical protein